MTDPPASVAELPAVTDWDLREQGYSVATVAEVHGADLVDRL